MKKFQMMLMVLLAISLTTVAFAEDLKIQETAHYKISLPGDWEGISIGDSIYTAMHPGASLTPVTVMVSVETITQEDKELSLEDLAEMSMEEGNAELLAAGLEDAIDVVESGEVKLNGYDAYHYAISINVMGMGVYTDSYIMTKDDKVISLAIIGDPTELTTLEPTITAIKKSFLLK